MKNFQIQKAAEYRWYGELRKWLIIGPDFDEILSVIDDKSMGVDTDFTIAIPINKSSSEAYELFDIYNPDKVMGGELNVSFLGTWSINDRFDLMLTQNKICRRANLHQMNFVASYLVSCVLVKKKIFGSLHISYSGQTFTNDAYVFEFLSHSLTINRKNWIQQFIYRPMNTSLMMPSRKLDTS